MKGASAETKAIPYGHVALNTILDDCNAFPVMHLLIAIAKNSVCLHLLVPTLLTYNVGFNIV